jgi:hypothetical protein
MHTLEYNIKMTLRELGEEGVYWVRVAQDTDWCEHGNGRFGSMKHRGFLGQLRDKKGSAAWSYLVHEGQSSLYDSIAVVRNTDLSHYVTIISKFLCSVLSLCLG